MVLRLVASFVCAVIFGTLTHAAEAACRPGALGTSRVIEIDAGKFHKIRGKEKALGLRNKEVILTFDDGPIAGKTPRILKALKNECVKATFFYVGTMARAYPKYVRQVVSDGHTLGHHTHNHNNLRKYSSAKVSKLIDRGIRDIERIAYGKSGARPVTPFFRYPYLSRNKRTDRILRKKGLIAFDANIDSSDWRKISSTRVHNRIMRRLRKQGRGIVLMHDIQGRTAKMLPRLLRSLKKEGYRIVHIVPAGQGPKPDTKDVVVAKAQPLKKEIQSEAVVTTSKDSKRSRGQIDLSSPEKIIEVAVRKAYPDRPVLSVTPKPVSIIAGDATTQRSGVKTSIVTLGAPPPVEPKQQLGPRPIPSSASNNNLTTQSIKTKDEPRSVVVVANASQKISKNAKIKPVSDVDVQPEAADKVGVSKAVLAKRKWKLRRSQWILR